MSEIIILDHKVVSRDTRESSIIKEGIIGILIDIKVHELGKKTILDRIKDLSRVLGIGGKEQIDVAAISLMSESIQNEFVKKLMHAVTAVTALSLDKKLTTNTKIYLSVYENKERIYVNLRSVGTDPRLSLRPYEYNQDKFTIKR